MSFFCKRYQQFQPNAMVFNYCMKRTPNGGKCSELVETKKGGKRANHAHRRSRDRHSSVSNQVRSIRPSDEAFSWSEEMDT